MPPGSRSESLPASVGRYEVVRILGEGAMGRVLLAHDPVLDRDIAIKHLRGDLQIPRGVRDGLLLRLRHEARAAARVPHPNLVVLHDMGEDPELGLYLVFEYIEGPTLKQRIASGGRLSAREVARLARELGDALTTSHEAGILHRDVKPENIMLAKTGGKIADFGIARVPDSTLTQHGGLLGTPAYSAPETFRAGKFSPASDQFSLAASLYEALSACRAFPGDDAVSVAAQIAHADPEPVARRLGLPAEIDQVLARGLARRPEARFTNCRAFGEALQHGLTAGGPSPSPWSQDRSETAAQKAPHPKRLPVSLVLGAAVVGVTTLLLLRSVMPTPEAPTSPAASSTETASTASARAHLRTPMPRARPRSDASSMASAQVPPTPSVDAGSAVRSPSVRDEP